MADEKIIVTEDDEENYVCAVNEIVQVREFNAREIKQGKHLEFINELMKINEDPNSLYYNDIHIEQYREPKRNKKGEEDQNADYDLYIAVSWVKNTINDFKRLERNKVEDTYYGSFIFCGWDESIGEYIEFPDGSDAIVSEDLVEQTWALWLKHHPEWKLNKDGTWTNVLEYDKTETIDKDKIVN